MILHRVGLRSCHGEERSDAVISISKLGDCFAALATAWARDLQHAMTAFADGPGRERGL